MAFLSFQNSPAGREGYDGAAKRTRRDQPAGPCRRPCNSPCAACQMPCFGTLYSQTWADVTMSLFPSGWQAGRLYCLYPTSYLEEHVQDLLKPARETTLVSTPPKKPTMQHRSGVHCRRPHPGGRASAARRYTIMLSRSAPLGRLGPGHPWTRPKSVTASTNAEDSNSGTHACCSTLCNRGCPRLGSRSATPADYGLVM